MKHVFQEPHEVLFNLSGHIDKKYQLAQITAKAEVLLIETQKGHTQILLEHESDFIYYILEGSGYFLIDGEKEECKKGDLVVIPAETKFTFKGKLRMFLFITPPFSPDEEEVVEEENL